MLPLEGENIVLTGAAGGIGSIVALRLRWAGAYVIGIDQTEASSADETIIGDLGSQEGIRAITSQLVQRPVEGLINLAGVQYFGPFVDEPTDRLFTGYVVNLLAPVLLAQALLPRLRRTALGGRIVNIGSVFGAIPFAHFVSYSSAKAGLKGFSDALRRECADSSVSVTHIAPRAVDTPLATAKVHEFASATGMTMDTPDQVADRIVQALIMRRKNVIIGFQENIFARVNALVPGLVDKALAGNDRKAAALFR